MIPTSQIRDLRDAAERAETSFIERCVLKVSCDPTTVKALCTEILRMRGEE